MPLAPVGLLKDIAELFDLPDPINATIATF